MLFFFFFFFNPCDQNQICCRNIGGHIVLEPIVDSGYCMHHKPPRNRVSAPLCESRCVMLRAVSYSSLLERSLKPTAAPKAASRVPELCYAMLPWSFCFAADPSVLPVLPVFTVDRSSVILCQACQYGVTHFIKKMKHVSCDTFSYSNTTAATAAVDS